jgi:hypothetical protein
MNQLPVGPKIQGIITFNDLKRWYELCLSKKYEKSLGKNLLSDLEKEFNLEFPSTNSIIPFIKERKYDLTKLKNDWSIIID